MSSNFPIVIGNKKYWGLGIGKKVIQKLILRANENGLDMITIPEIYNYNHRSKRLFISLGFKKINGNNKTRTYQLDLHSVL